VNDPVEQHLRDALTERADRFPYDRAIDRLSGVDYSPRYGQRLSARIIGVLGASATAVIAVAVAVIVTIGGTPTQALAGWTPVPKALTSSQLTAIAHSVRENWAPRCSGPSGSIVLADVRGRYTYALFVTNPKTHVRLATICLNGVEHGSGGMRNSSVWPPRVAADRTRDFLTQYGVIDQRPGVVSPFVFTMVGRVGTAVRSVAVLLSTGTKVRATVGHGWYLVWWPAKEGYSKQLIITTNATSGSHTYEIPDNNGELPGCGAGPATNAAEIHAEAKLQRNRRQELRTLQHEHLTRQHERIALSVWTRRHGHPALGEKTHQNHRPC
jgi:hypothetical protein